MTALLAARAGRVVAVELDDVLAQRLTAHYADRPGVSIQAADILNRPLADLAGANEFLVVGNVPYYITTPILFHALRSPRAKRSVFLIQREVAERVVAGPGSEAYGALSVNVQALADATLVSTVPPGAFVPPPTVESAVLRVVPRSDPVVTDTEQEDFATFVIAAFGLRRKQMRRVLRTVARITAAEAERALAAAGVPPDARPEVLSAREFAALWRAVGDGVTR